MSEDLKAQIGVAVVGLITSVVGGAVAGVRKAGTSLEQLEKRLQTLERRLNTTIGKVADAEREATRQDAELDELRTLVEQLRTSLQDKLDSSTFSDQLSRDNERWQQLSRSIGHIEGILSAINDRLNIRSRR